jgi:hypothetical protein
MMFAVVMTEATALYVMEMVMTATTMCRTKIVREEAPNNAAGRSDVEAAPQGPQNDVPRQPEEVPVE